MRTLLKGIIRALIIGGLVFGSGCTPAASPSPTSVPAKSDTTPAPKLAASPAAKSEAPASKPGQESSRQDWKADWDKTVEAAKKEGKVVVAGGPGTNYRDGVMGFKKAYPDILLEYTGVSGSDFGPKLLAEQDAGKYLWDVHVGGATTGLTMLIPKKAVDPVRPLLVLPEVLDNASWVGGFEDIWMDKGRQYIVGFEGKANFTAYVNRDMVPESELNSIDQLIDAKWKGKIVSGDPRVTGSANGRSGFLMIIKGEDWIRKLYSQDLVVMKDERLMVEALVRNRYPIMFGINPDPIEQFKKEGVAGNIKPLAPDAPDGSTLSTGFGNLYLVTKAPHPNAAKVFINWLLSSEGMKSYINGTGLNTRRVGAEGPPEYAPKPNVKYIDLNKEENLPYKQRIMDIAKEMIKQ